MTTRRRTQLPAPYLAGARAGFVSRLLALAIDVVLLVIALLVGNALWVALIGAPPVRRFGATLIAVAPGLAPWLTRAGLLLPAAVGVGIVCGYFLFFSTITGQTIGKRVLGLQVVAADGGRLPLGRAALRLAGYLISAAPLYLGFLAALLDKRKRAWHDRLAGSAVIYAWNARPDERFLARAIAWLDR
jgi:uncharacterized RDD family membrane protein YckC